MCKRNKDVAERHWGDDDNCCLQCLGCLARVPCATLTAWVFLVLTAATCCGALIIGTEKSRDLLQQDEHFLGAMTTTCICVLFGMVFFSTLFLLVSLVSSGRTSKQIFDSMKKNYCARAINIVAIVVMVVLQLIWVVITCVLFIPILFFGVVHVLFKDRDYECIDLQDYAITNNATSKFCVDSDDPYNLGHMYYKSKEAMICLGIAYAAAVMVTLCMSLFMVFSSANIIYLKEGRFATYNVYRNGMTNNAGGPVTYVDTKM